MDITSIKTGNIFYYDDYTPRNDKTHRHKCRVLFVGSENIFYDAWWDGINKWTFVPVSKRLSYYRLPLTQLGRLNFNGYEEIDQKSAAKLFLGSPEILLNFKKEDISQNQDGNKLIEVFSDIIAFVPIGSKRGKLKPILIDSKRLTKELLIKAISANQNLDFIHADNITVHRIGLHGGVPSYCIRT